MQIQDVIMHLLLKQPFFGYIAASVTPVQSIEVPTITSRLTPAPMVLYNPNWFESLSDQQSIGIVIHEILHLMLLHHFRQGNREWNLWVVACDMAVNEHIEKAILPDDAVTVDNIAKEFNEILPKLKSAEAYYDILIKTENKLSLVGNDREIKVVLKTGQELTANNTMEGDSSEVNKNAVKSMFSELIQQAKEEGEIPGSINSLIGDIYKASEVNWRNVLKRFLSGKGKVQVRKTCKRESKRFENLPGNKRSFGTNVLLALDESGSISDELVTKFYQELLAIKKVTGASVDVTQFDIECTQPVPIERYIRKKERVKNGGTDFRPVFQLADQLRTPLLIIFTDGEGVAPECSNQKVLWVLTKGGKNPTSFGEYIKFQS